MTTEQRVAQAVREAVDAVPVRTRARRGGVRTRAAVRRRVGRRTRPAAAGPRSGWSGPLLAAAAVVVAAAGTALPAGAMLGAIYRMRLQRRTAPSCRPR